MEIKEWYQSLNDNQRRTLWIVSGVAAFFLAWALLFSMFQDDKETEGAYDAPTSMSPSGVDSSQVDGAPNTEGDVADANDANAPDDETASRGDEPSGPDAPEDNEFGVRHDDATRAYTDGESVLPYDAIMRLAFEPVAPEAGAVNNPGAMNQKASQVANITDTIVNNPTPNGDGFNEVVDRLADLGIRAGGSIAQSYEMIGYITADDNLFVSRAVEPFINPTPTQGVYTISYKTAAGIVPVTGYSENERARLVAESNDSLVSTLSSGVAVDVKFTLDLNANTLEVSPVRWW